MPEFRHSPIPETQNSKLPNLLPTLSSASQFLISWEGCLCCCRVARALIIWGSLIHILYTAYMIVNQARAIVLDATAQAGRIVGMSAGYSLVAKIWPSPEPAIPEIPTFSSAIVKSLVRHRYPGLGSCLMLVAQQAISMATA